MYQILTYPTIKVAVFRCNCGCVFQTDNYTYHSGYKKPDYWAILPIRSYDEENFVAVYEAECPLCHNHIMQDYKATEVREIEKPHKGEDNVVY